MFTSRLFSRSVSFAIFGLAAATFLLAMNGCTKRTRDIQVVLPSGEKATLALAETLRVNIMSEPPTLDWNRSSDTTSSTVIDNIMEGLVEYDLADKELNLKPALATKWESSDHAKKWKFTLRKDVEWSDGQPFVAQHVIDGWHRLLARETACEYAYFLFGVRNAQAFNQGKAKWEDVGVRAISPYEIEVELNRPMSYFPSLLTHTSTFPVRLDVIQKGGDQWTEPGKIVTLGPFNLMAWQHDKMLALVRNEHYYGAKPFLKHVAFYMLQEHATAINLFDSDKLDAVFDLPSIELRKLRTKPEFRQTNLLQIYYYGMNLKKPPMDNVLVRRAISMAINRQELVQMLAGGELPLSGWVPPGMFGYESQVGSTFDPEKAKQLLAQAGFNAKHPAPKIEIKFNTNEDHQRIAENIQSQLKKNLGLNVELKNEEWKVFLNTLKSDPPQLYRFGWLADYPDPDNFLAIVTSFSDNNHLNWKNAKYDDLVTRAAGETDRDARRKLSLQAQKVLLEEDFAAIPLFVSVTHFLLNNRVQNYPINVMNKKIFKGVSLK